MRSAARRRRELRGFTAGVLIDFRAAMEAGQSSGQQQENGQKVDAAAAHEWIIGSAGYCARRAPGGFRIRMRD